MVTLEVCVDSIEGAQAAVRGGADRIELCSALTEGGLTPSYGLMQSAAALPVPCVAMIRPRAGNFQFTERDVEVMLADIDAVKRTGLAGVVLGAQSLQGGLDIDVLKQLVHRAEGLTCSLHRVIDVVSHPLIALDDAVKLGFTRVLTSGGRATAIEGLSNIVNMIDHANGRIDVMPGSGLKPRNLEKVLATGVREVHSSCSSRLSEAQCLPEAAFAANTSESERTVTSEQLVADMRYVIGSYIERIG